VNAEFRVRQDSRPKGRNNLFLALNLLSGGNEPPTLGRIYKINININIKIIKKIEMLGYRDLIKCEGVRFAWHIALSS
jgi:hypothetical protein